MLAVDIVRQGRLPVGDLAPEWLEPVGGDIDDEVADCDALGALKRGHRRIGAGLGPDVIEEVPPRFDGLVQYEEALPPGRNHTSKIPTPSGSGNASILTAAAAADSATRSTTASRKPPRSARRAPLDALLGRKVEGAELFGPVVRQATEV